MPKTRTKKLSADERHKRAEEFHQKLESGAKAAAVHKKKIDRDAEEALSAENTGNEHGRSPVAHLNLEEPAKPASKRPAGEPNTGRHPGALLKR